MFVNRYQEVEFLRSTQSRDSFQLIPIWGRRRIGKTSLLTHSLGKDAYYFLAVESTSIDNLKRFSDGLSKHLNDEIVKDLELDWEVLFRYISNKGICIIIDEFPYLISEDASIPSRFQRIVDIVLKGTSTKLYLCGSSIRMMESFVLSYKAPLYGRRTGQIHLKPLEFRHLNQMLPGYGLEDLIRVYGMCGGVPSYILQFDNSKSLWKNVENVFLNRFSFMFQEEGFLLKQEFKNISKYRSILNELASGRTKVGEVRDSLSIKRSDITPYLSNLKELQIIKREVPVTDDPIRSRSGLYTITDQYLRFYYTFLYSRISMIESNETSGVLSWIRKNYDAYLGHVFEEIVEEVFRKWCSDKKIVYDKTGRWWHGEDEIDIVGLNQSDNSMITIEVKWSKKKRTKVDVENLLLRSEKVRWGNNDTDRSYLYVSRGGFTDPCLEWMDDEGIMHWDLNDISKILWNEEDK